MLSKMRRIVVLVIILGILLIGISATAQVKDEDSIIRMTSDWPTYFDPAVGSDFSDTITLVNIYDTLVFPNPDGSVRPQVATKWDISEDGLTYKFYIRKGVKFHSGNELTAEDVAFSMNRLITIGEGYAYLYKGVIENATALDRYTVEFKLNDKFGPFVSSLIRLLIAEKQLVMANIDKTTGIYGEFGDYGKHWLLTNDAGSGPYKVKEVKMEEYILGEKFDDYWGGWDKDAPKYFKLSGATAPTTVRTAIFRQELEISDEMQPMENYEAMAKIEGVKVVSYINGNNFNVTLNTKKPPTDDIHFRKALAYVIDYEVIVDNIFPYSKISNGPVPANLPGADNSLRLYKRDLEKAKEELKLSKYYSNLKDYPVIMTWCAEVPDEEKVALLFQANCAELGIVVEITKKPFGAMIADAQTIDTTPNASLVFVAPSYIEAGGMLKTRYHSSSLGTWEQMEWVQDSELDAQIEDALATADKVERFKKYSEIQKKIIELCPTIWLFDQAERRAYQDSYIYWPTAEMVETGQTFINPMGYNNYVHDMKVFPEKRSK